MTLDVDLITQSATFCAGLFIDARKRGNASRMLNSSCDPNCETQKWHDGATGEARVGIFARRDIAPEEELTYDYMFEHYGHSAPAEGALICMCGAHNCRQASRSQSSLCHAMS